MKREADAAPMTHCCCLWLKPQLLPGHKTLETAKKQVFAEATREGTCLQNTEEEEEEEEEKGKTEESRLRGSWGECLGGSYLI